MWRAHGQEENLEGLREGVKPVLLRLLLRLLQWAGLLTWSPGLQFRVTMRKRRWRHSVGRDEAVPEVLPPYRLTYVAYNYAVGESLQRAKVHWPVHNNMPDCVKLSNAGFHSTEGMPQNKGISWYPPPTQTILFQDAEGQGVKWEDRMRERSG